MQTLSRIPAADLWIGADVRLGETSRRVVDLRPVGRGGRNVVVVLEGVGDWEVAADYSVAIYLSASSALAFLAGGIR